MDRLSSNYLFHYKRDINVVKLILEHGFRYSMWDERVIFRDSVQQNFVVCFCDILADQADYHRNCYGGIAVVLTKEWGVNNAVSPVRYVHKNSTGQLPDYIKIKNINRHIRELNNSTTETHQYALDYLLLSLARYNGGMPEPSISQSATSNPNWDNMLGSLDNELTSLTDALQASGKEQLFYKYLTVFGNVLNELHNELEARDAIVRVYQDDFTSPATGNLIKDKVLYDEREWRAVKFISTQDFIVNPSEYSTAVNNGFLPPRLNLKFSDEDCVAILVNSQEERESLVNFIDSSNGTLLVKESSKVKLYSEFTE